MTAAMHWTVIAVDGVGHGRGLCGHRHETANEATVCSWTPDPWPEVCDLLVRQVRTDQPRRVTQLAMPWGVIAIGAAP